MPCFNEEAVLGETCRRVLAAATEAVGGDFEVIFVDDGSKDRTWTLIGEMAETHGPVRGLRLSRNFGHQAALTAGLEAATGAHILILDADLQDPPELLGAMLERLKQGYDVVYGKRRKRAAETPFKKATAFLFYRFINALSDIPIPADTGDFRLMRREAVDALLAMPEQHRFIRGMVSWTGFRQSALVYDRDARAAGETKYPLWKMIRFATDAVTSFSVKPLRLASLVGFLGIVASAFLWLYVAYSLVFGETIPGWSSLLAVVTFFGSAQLITLGIIGEYLGRTYMESKRRPLFFVSEECA